MDYGLRLSCLVYYVSPTNTQTHKGLYRHQCPLHTEGVAIYSPCTPKALSLGVECQILGVKISAHVIPMCQWHAHSKRLDPALRKHDVLF